jgi:hypothetical protein
MATTAAVIGERALRHLGVAIVPVASRPALSAVVSVTTIAATALQALGVTVPEAARPATGVDPFPSIIATNALIWLGVIASDETPSATDQALALAKVTAIHDTLIDQGIASWTTSFIPLGVSEEYTMLTALHLAPSFGKVADPSQVPALEARIRHVSLLMQAQTLAEARVAAIHDSLVAQAFVTWANTAIPQAVSDDYVALCVAQMAPVFGGQSDLKAVPMIEARIRHVAMIMAAPDLATQAVLSVHQNLEARGLVRWSIQDLPPAAEDPYMMLAADMIWPDMGVSQVRGDAEAARRALAQIIALPTSGERVQAEYF